MMTEEERMGLKQSEAFFNFGSDGEELGGDLEDALEPPPRTNGSASMLTHKMESLTMTPPSALPPHHMAAASPHGPLTVQTAGPPLTPGGPAYPGHYAPHQHLLPPSAFASTGPALQDPAIMSMVPGVTPVPPAMVGNLVSGVKPPPFPPQPNFPPTQHGLPQQQQAGLHQQHHQGGHQQLHRQPGAPRQAGFSPPTVPGMKSMADLEAEMLYGSRPAMPPSGPPPPVAQPHGHGGNAPVPVQQQGNTGGPLGHLNPAMHNLSYPGMRDRSAVPLHHQGGNQAKHPHIPQQPQQRPPQQQGHMQQPPPGHHIQHQPPPVHQLQHPHNLHQPPPQFRQSPQMVQQQMHQRNNNNNMDSQHQRNNNMEMPRNNNNMEKSCQEMGQRYHDVGERGDHGHHQDHRRFDHQHNHGYNNEHQFNDRRGDQFYDGRNDRGGGGYEQQRHNNRYHDQDRQQPRGYDQNRFDQRFQENRYFEQATRRDLMPGHVHTLGILKHSRSRHDRSQRGGIEDDDCLLGDNEELSYNPTGDPLLDAKMLQEREELGRKRRIYEQCEDEYAGLMTQRDKQWIINIQLNQLKCDNPYVDDYYFTMYQARKEREGERGEKAGGQLLLNDSLAETPGSYIPTQFENSLGKLQFVTVKAPRQIIDVGVVRSTESPIPEGGSPAPGAEPKRTGADYKQVLIQIEGLYLALLNLESDQLKLHALPTGAPLREQVAVAESQHLAQLQAGLAKTPWLADCLAVPKGRSLVLRSLPHLSPPRATAVCGALLAKLHLLARGDKVDTRFWLALSHYIKAQECPVLEPAVRDLLSLSKKAMSMLLGSSLGMTCLLSLLVKASKSNPVPANPVWANLANMVITAAMEGTAIGPAMVSLDFGVDSLDSLVKLSETQKKIWSELVKGFNSS